MNQAKVVSGVSINHVKRNWSIMPSDIESSAATSPPWIPRSAKSTRTNPMKRIHPQRPTQTMQRNSSWLICTPAIHQRPYHLWPVHWLDRWSKQFPPIDQRRITNENFQTMTMMMNSSKDHFQHDESWNYSILLSVMNNKFKTCCTNWLPQLMRVSNVRRHHHEIVDECVLFFVQFIFLFFSSSTRDNHFDLFRLPCVSVLHGCVHTNVDRNRRGTAFIVSKAAFFLLEQVSDEREQSPLWSTWSHPRTSCKLCSGWTKESIVFIQETECARSVILRVTTEKDYHHYRRLVARSSSCS